MCKKYQQQCFPRDLPGFYLANDNVETPIERQKYALSENVWFCRAKAILKHAILIYIKKVILLYKNTHIFKVHSHVTI